MHWHSLTFAVLPFASTAATSAPQLSSTLTALTWPPSAADIKAVCLHTWLFEREIGNKHTEMSKAPDLVFSVHVGTMVSKVLNNLMREKEEEKGRGRKGGEGRDQETFVEG